MGIMVTILYSLFGILQDLYHQPYHCCSDHPVLHILRVRTGIPQIALAGSREREGHLAHATPGTLCCLHKAVSIAVARLPPSEHC